MEQDQQFTRLTEILTDALLEAIGEFESGEQVLPIVSQIHSLFSSVCYSALISYAQTNFPSISLEEMDETMGKCSERSEELMSEFVKGTRPISDMIAKHVAEWN